ncbi:MAG TPA: DUF4136 domain-containing protein [Pseudomonadales bacterium]|nr:DUF4136 domain-containing protein [Pseudomonadales bacterium]
MFDRRVMSAAAALLLLALAGCASGPSIRSDVNPDSDLASYRTYGWVETLGTDKAGYESLVTGRLKAAVGNELEARGYRYDENQPDMLVNFYVNLEEKQQVVTTPAAGMSYGRGYYGFRTGYYSTWPTYETRVSEYTEGTLTVDLVDARLKVLAWNGTLQDRVTKKVMEDPQGALRAAVAALFDAYPYRAP